MSARRHPFDLDAVKRYVLAHTSAFERLASAHFCPTALHARSTTLGQRILVEPRPDDAYLVARLTR